MPQKVPVWHGSEFELALGLSGILTVTGGIHGGLRYVSMHSKLERSQEKNLKVVFFSGEIQVLLTRLIARLAFQNRWPGGFVRHLIQVLISCRCSLAWDGASDASDSAIRREAVLKAPVITWASILWTLSRLSMMYWAAAGPF